MEGNLGNSALYPGLVPAESRLTNCFCLGKENKPSLGVDMQGNAVLTESPEPCVHRQRGHPPPVQAAVQHIWQGSTEQGFQVLSEKKGGEKTNKES